MADTAPEYSFGDPNKAVGSIDLSKYRFASEWDRLVIDIHAHGVDESLIEPLIDVRNNSTTTTKVLI